VIGIGIIGFGYWGPNLLRNFANLETARVVAVADSREDRFLKASKSHPAVKFTGDAGFIFSNPEIDAVVIATPVLSHHTLALKALKAGKHVLIEKPMAASIKECEELMELAASKKLLLMVDHTFLYTGAVKKLKEISDSGDLGTLRYYDSTRINLGLFQADVNVLWDLAPHDISILNYLVKEQPVCLNATGISHLNNGIENIAYITMKYQNGLIAHFNCSWTSPVKIRQILIGGDKKMVLFNDMDPSEKLKVYDTGYSVKSDEDKRDMLINYRTGDVYCPKIEIVEALQGVAHDFVNSIVNGTQPVSNMHLGLQVVSILEAASRSIRQNGAEVRL